MPRGLVQPFICVDDKLAAIVGEGKSQISATELTRAIWTYIKANGLMTKARKV